MTDFIASATYSPEDNKLRLYLNELWCDLLDLKANDEKAKSFARLKKGEKAKSMEKLFSDEDTRKLHAVTQKQAAKIDKWLPEGMN